MRGMGRAGVVIPVTRRQKIKRQERSNDRDDISSTTNSDVYSVRSFGNGMGNVGNQNVGNVGTSMGNMNMRAAAAAAGNAGNIHENVNADAVNGVNGHSHDVEYKITNSNSDCSHVVRNVDTLSYASHNLTPPGSGSKQRLLGVGVQGGQGQGQWGGGSAGRDFTFSAGTSGVESETQLTQGYGGGPGGGGGGDGVQAQVQAQAQAAAESQVHGGQGVEVSTFGFDPPARTSHESKWTKVAGLVHTDMRNSANNPMNLNLVTALSQGSQLSRSGHNCHNHIGGNVLNVNVNDHDDHDDGVPRMPPCIPTTQSQLRLNLCHELKSRERAAAEDFLPDPRAAAGPGAGGGGGGGRCRGDEDCKFFDVVQEILDKNRGERKGRHQGENRGENQNQGGQHQGGQHQGGQHQGGQSAQMSGGSGLISGGLSGRLLGLGNLGQPGQLEREGSSGASAGSGVSSVLRENWRKLKKQAKKVKFLEKVSVSGGLEGRESEGGGGEETMNLKDLGEGAGEGGAGRGEGQGQGSRKVNYSLSLKVRLKLAAPVHLILLWISQRQTNIPHNKLEVLEPQIPPVPQVPAAL